LRVPSATRRAFRRQCLAEIDERFGPAARETATVAGRRPDQLDVIGAALLEGVAPVPVNVPVAVERFGREYGLDD
jgi:hypothetical protein